MDAKTAWQEYQDKFPDCRDYLAFDTLGEAILDGTYTAEQLRFIADLIEKLAK